mgnify:CR=1 FL=1
MAIDYELFFNLLNQFIEIYFSHCTFIDLWWGSELFLFLFRCLYSHDFSQIKVFPTLCRTA